MFLGGGSEKYGDGGGAQGMDAEGLAEQSCARGSGGVVSGDSKMGDTVDKPESAVGPRGVAAEGVEGVEHADDLMGESGASLGEESSAIGWS